jgi:hypothetical protein
MGIAIGIIIVIIVAFAFFYYLGKKDMKETGEILITTRRGQERLNMDEMAIAMAEMSVSSFSNSDISIFWTEQMADTLSEKESEITLKVANYIRGIMYRKNRIDLTDKETSTISALVVYYALGYDDFYDSKQDVLNNIISAYSNNDLYGILNIQSCARYHAEHKD